jgi:hypothetical protein
MRVKVERGVYSAAVAVAGAGMVVLAPNHAWVGWMLLALALALLLWGIRLNDHPIWRRSGAHSEDSVDQPQTTSQAGQGATVTGGNIQAGRGGDAQFWGGGGGGGGGLSVMPDGSIQAGGGGGGGGLSPGGQGGGPLGGGGGGAVGLPPEFMSSGTGQILQLLWRLKQEYRSETGNDVEVLPEDWTNRKLAESGSNLKYRIEGGHATFTTE